MATATILALQPVATDTERPRSVPLPVGLFVCWTSLFWLTVVWDAGVGVYVMNTARALTRACVSDPLAATFAVWESAPVSEHLFIGWRSAELFQKHWAYVNHVHPYLFTMYAWVAAVRGLTGLPLTAASNTTVFPYMLVLIGAVVTVLARLGLLRQVRDARGLLVLFVALGFLITTWRFWHDALRYTSDNVFPFVTAVLVFAYASWLPPVRAGLAIAAGTLYAAFVPLHTPMLLVPVVCLFGEWSTPVRELIARNRTILWLGVSATIAGFLAIALPRVLAAWKGYLPLGNPFMFRSGLDGDATYFTNMVQAVWSPDKTGCWPRTIGQLLFPACLPLVALAPFLARDADATRWRVQVGRLLLFLSTPYLMSVVLFPQSVSVHPYLYDHLLVIPLVISGVALMLTDPIRRRLAGAPLLLFLLFAAALIMSNVIAIAQSMKPA